MSIKSQLGRAFTLVELLVVMAVIGILAALVFPALSAAKSKAGRTTCLNNTRQINLGVRMYCDDSHDALSAGKNPQVAYRELVKNYVGVKGSSSAKDNIFACPADTFYYDLTRSSNGYFNTWTAFFQPLHENEHFDYSSYAFNGCNARSMPPSDVRLGIAGRKLTSIKNPAKTVLVAEWPAFDAYSWHAPRKPIGLSPGEKPMFKDAKAVVSFVDGHVSYVRIYWSEVCGRLAFGYDPPAGYDYKWSGD